MAISEDQVEKALDYLRDNAEAIGAARAEAIKSEHMIKHAKALAMSLHLFLPVSAQEREAHASQQWVDAVNAAAAAAGAYEEMKSRREAAALKIEAWRSMNATYRQMKI